MSPPCRLARRGSTRCSAVADGRGARGLGLSVARRDFQDDSVDLNELLIRNAPATFLYQADDWSMILIGIATATSS